MADDIEALRALSEQHGVPGIDLSQIAILLEHLNLIPREVSESRLILCVLARGERLFLAMANPMDRRVIDEVEFVTGRKVYPYVALQPPLLATIKAAYDAASAGEPYYLGPNVPAETLRQLGITPPQAPGGGRQAPPGPVRSPGTMHPGAPGVVVDERVRRASERVDISQIDFSDVRDEVAELTPLPVQISAPPRGAEPAGGGQTKLVLVVDDEEDIRKLLNKLLTQKGFRVVEADRGTIALRMVKEQTPDVIVLDAMLPEIHGFDIAKRIKGSERYGRIPIIMVSAVYKGWHIAADLKENYGIDEYLEKPFRIGDVVAAIQRCITGPQGARPVARDPEKMLGEAERTLNEGIARYQSGDLAGAIAQLRRGIEIDPLAYRLHFHLALLYGKNGQVYEAIQELEKAVDLNPKHFAAQKNLAVLYEKAGFKNKAVEVWTRCVQIAPDEATRTNVKKHLMELL